MKPTIPLKRQVIPNQNETRFWSGVHFQELRNIASSKDQGMKRKHREETAGEAPCPESLCCQGSALQHAPSWCR